MTTIYITVNGEKFSFHEKISVYDAISLSKTDYAEDCKIAVVKMEKISSEEDIKDFFIETTKGRFSIRIEDSFFLYWKKIYKDFQRVGIRWVDRNTVSFGSVNLSLLGFKASREKFRYREGDIFLSFGGFDPTYTFLCFTRIDHDGIYGFPKETGGVIGKVTSGKQVLSKLEKEDFILQIYPAVAEGKRTQVLGCEETKRVDVEDGMQILTYIKVALQKNAPNCVEHFLAAIRDGFFRVDETSSMFICNEEITGLTLPEENTDYRVKGAVTVRNNGEKSGAVYIYRREAPSTPSHSVVGKIVHGMELVENVNLGDKILVKTIPEHFMVVGLRQDDATRYLSERGIKHTRLGGGDEAVIVEQRPKLSMEVAEQKSIVTLAVKPEHIVRIKLYYDEAPQSIMHFKLSADMIYSPVGKLQVVANTGETLILCGSGKFKTTKPIPSEKIPEDVVEERTIGVTNLRRKLMGSIGIKLRTSKKYGPTGEAFEATNIIGRVVGGFEILKNKKTGDYIYLMEEK